MNLPTQRWLRIVEYRDFSDIPRYFLATDGTQFWILDGPFDDENDEYAANFVIHFVGTNEREARHLFLQQATIPSRLESTLPSIAIVDVRFDETSRAQCMVGPAPGK
jgi:hypothetical protein